jgi:hypothetical protein
MGIYVTIICDIVKLAAMLFGLISAPMMRCLRQPSSYAPEGSRLFATFHRLAAGVACISRLQTKLWRQEISDLGG